MHPWMIEQVAREQRRDLLARAARPRARRAGTWRKLVTYIGIVRNDRRPALAPLSGGAPAGQPTPTAPDGELATGTTMAGSCQASAA